MMVIVGLGNPGKKFEKTPHNIGFLTLDSFFKENREKFSFSAFKLQKKLFSEISEGRIKRKKVILAKPQTFVNQSGKAVKKIKHFWKIKTENLFVVHDDIDLPLGKIKISKNRGSGGHNGVESIIEELKTKNFVRFRVGVNPYKNKKPSRKFIIQRFKKREQKIVQDSVKKTVKAIETAIFKGLEKAMNEYNK